MTKKYNSPMLQVVSVKNNVIATSVGVETGCTLGNDYNESDVSYSAGRGNVFDRWYEGY